MQPDTPQPPSPGMSVPGMAHGWLEHDGIRIHFVHGGTNSAEPLVLLHGFPQSWIIWRAVLPALLNRHRVVAVDLRGYGDSSKPEDIAAYEKSRMAADIRALALHLNLPRFLLVGHDRGARVARRYALDYPNDLVGVALLDILPAEYIYYQLAAAEVARRYWHWIFHLVPDLPEQLIGGREDAYLAALFGRDPGFAETLRADGAWDEYLRCFQQPGAVLAALNDYRATFTLDVPRYRAERAAGQLLKVPAYLLWGERGNLGGQPVLDIWREVATDVQGAELAGCGHYLPEEQPEAVIRHLLQFAAMRFAERAGQIR